MKTVRRKRSGERPRMIRTGPGISSDRCDDTCADRGVHFHGAPSSKPRVWAPPRTPDDFRALGRVPPPDVVEGRGQPDRRILFRDLGDALHRSDNWLPIWQALRDGKPPPEPVFSDPVPGKNLFPKGVE